MLARRGTAPTISGVVHGASFGSAIVAGSWVSVIGSRLGTRTRIWEASDFVRDRLPTSLDGVRVNINGRPALVYFVSSTQVNVLAPDDPTVGPVAVEVVTNEGRSNTFMAQKAALGPALFLFDAGARRYPAAVHVDGAYLAPLGLFPASLAHRPARPGDTVLLFGTGCGPTNPPAPADRLVSGALPLTNIVSARVGGIVANVQFAGLVGSGLCQYNLRIPETAANGDNPLRLAIGGVESPATFIAVQR